MRHHLSFAPLCLLIAACDSDPRGANEECVFGHESETEFYVLPTQREAKKMADAFKARQRGTLNLLLAKYANKNVAKGTKCQLLEEKGEYVKVAAEPGPTGWVLGVKVGRGQ